MNTHRLLVRGSRIPYEDAELVEMETAQEELAASSWEQHYLWGLGIGLGAATLAAMAILLVIQIRKRLTRGGRYGKR